MCKTFNLLPADIWYVSSFSFFKQKLQTHHMLSISMQFLFFLFWLVFTYYTIIVIEHSFPSVGTMLRGKILILLSERHIIVIIIIINIL